MENSPSQPDIPLDGPSGFADTVAEAAPPTPDARVPEFADSSTDDEAPDPQSEPTLMHIGRYALKRPLGLGGLGTVYEAWDPMLSRTVAVKTLQFDIDTPTRVSLDGLFLNEARAVAGLNHAHIVTVYDAGLSAHGVYIAMERLKGRDLRQALARGWRPSPLAAAQLARRVADALAYAHARGVIHCDIKPANIFLSAKGKPTVLDFGIARVAHGAAVPALEGLVAGSPHYLSPEQLAGGAFDERADIYALGVVLYEMLAGRKAFDGSSLEQITNAVLHGHPAPADIVQPGVSPALAAITARAMARDPGERFATAHDLAGALRQWIEGHQRDKARAEASGRRTWWPWAAAGAAGFTVAAAVYALAWPWPPAAAPETAPPLTAVDSPAVHSTLPITATVAEPAAIQAPVAIDPPPAAAPSRTARPSPRPAAKPAPAKPPAILTGVVQLAISPWGQIEVDGRPAGLTPPLSKLELSEGSHQITVRNGDNPPFTATVRVNADKPVVVRHRFGS